MKKFAILFTALTLLGAMSLSAAATDIAPTVESAPTIVESVTVQLPTDAPNMTKERTETTYSDGTSSIETLTVTRTNDKARSIQYAYADYDAYFPSASHPLTFHTNASFSYDPQANTVSCLSKGFTIDYSGPESPKNISEEIITGFHKVTANFHASIFFANYNAKISCDTNGNIEKGISY